MSYTIYRNTQQGRELVADGVNYRTAEIYREFIRNCIVEDSANTMPSDIDTIEPSDYGVTERSRFSASCVFACIALVPCLILTAYLIQ